MDHNARFARTLGFNEDAPWSLNTPFVDNYCNENVVNDVLNELALGILQSDCEDSGRLSYLDNDSIES